MRTPGDFMQRAPLFSFLALLFVLACCPIASGQSDSVPRYDIATFISITGKIERIGTIKSPTFKRFGLHFLVKDEHNASYFVHLCPQWYADDHPELFNFKENDLITVAGSQFSSKVTENNIYAATVTNCSRNYSVLRLRDPQTGDALWNNQPKELHAKIQEMQQFAFVRKSQIKQQEMAGGVPGEVMSNIRSMMNDAQIDIRAGQNVAAPMPMQPANLTHLPAR
jgi:hypothetical protein